MRSLKHGMLRCIVADLLGGSVQPRPVHTPLPLPTDNIYFEPIVTLHLSSCFSVSRDRASAGPIPLARNYPPIGLKDEQIGTLFCFYQPSAVYTATPAIITA
jgi:hypothetical protein